LLPFVAGVPSYPPFCPGVVAGKAGPGGVLRQPCPSARQLDPVRDFQRAAAAAAAIAAAAIADNTDTADNGDDCADGKDANADVTPRRLRRIYRERETFYERKTNQAKTEEATTVVRVRIRIRVRTSTSASLQQPISFPFHGP